MLEFEKPFKHILIDDFLSQDNFKLIEEIYRSCQFNLKYTDLFKFLQTDELANKSWLGFFKKELTKIFDTVTDTRDTFYTIFASYYRKGDYLSCHDDMVDGRMYAFTYYLSDLESGDLILFNNECTEEFKRISIKKNRLVIFEVSDISWHEVDICKSDGRMSITGWLNNESTAAGRMSITGWLNNESTAILKKYVDNYSLPENIEVVDFDLDFSENILEFDGMEYNFDHTDDSFDKITDGKLSMRRVNNLKLDTYVALNISDYQLIYINSYLIEYSSYILLNDTTNLLEGDLLDIFIISCDEKQDGNIKLVDEEGSLVQTLNIKKNVMYVVKRGNMKYFIERAVCKTSYYLMHMIYKKDQNILT
ncbi:hypothetical protein P3W45_001034 [Vairimorpha bombi]